ncbi:hypothetical protein QUB05_06230 [Microcoleus sp. F10-C6]|uniref:hypothetical protein n=1 Tax=unclassified Microcoleus TaxID=2642155 RepID=UPI002FCF8E81
MSFTLIVPQTSIWYLVRGAIALGRIIAVFGIWCEGRSILMREGRSLLVESSQCLVFGVRGDRATPCFPPMQAQITWKLSDLICCAVCAT